MAFGRLQEPILGWGAREGLAMPRGETWGNLGFLMEPFITYATNLKIDYLALSMELELFLFPHFTQGQVVCS